MQNGVHVDSLGPSTITRWVEFLKLYVANEVPSIPPAVLALSGELYRFLADAGAAPVQQSRLAGLPSAAAARAVFERDPRVRLLMDNGAGPQGPGSIGATWELEYSAWPPKQVRAEEVLPRARRARSAGGRRTGGAARYRPDPTRAAGADPAGRGRGGRLEGAAALRLGADRGREGSGLRLGAAHARRRRRRTVEPRPLPQVVCPRHRPPGHPQRGPPRRQRDLRPERLAACLAAQAGPPPLHRPQPVSHPPQEGRRPAAPRHASPWSACRSSRWPTPSEPGRACG